MAGFSKLGQPAWIFQANVASFRLVPDSAVNLVAAALPFFEILAGCWLAINWRIRAPALSLGLLSLGFVFALAQAELRGLDVHCGCFGESASALPLWLEMIRDLAILGAALFVYREACKEKVPPQTSV